MGADSAVLLLWTFGNVSCSGFWASWGKCFGSEGVVAELRLVAVWGPPREALGRCQMVVVVVVRLTEWGLGAGG